MGKIGTRLERDAQNKSRKRAARLFKGGRTYVEIGELSGVPPTHVRNGYKVHEHDRVNAEKQGRAVIRIIRNIRPDQGIHSADNRSGATIKIAGRREIVA